MGAYSASLEPTILLNRNRQRKLEISQKQSRGNQLIHRHLSKTKSIGSGSDPESQAGKHSDDYLLDGVWS